MKTFKQYLKEANNYFKVGDGVKFNLDAIADYIDDMSVLGGFDWGKVESVKGDSYVVRLDNGNTVTIKSDDVYAYGNADAT